MPQHYSHLYSSLAEEEMREISKDRWDEEVWGAEKEDQDTKSRAPKLVFFFGQNVIRYDHFSFSAVLT
jgi:hypothetical protein